ncbi:MAG: hypothetical protein R3C15_03895 [Thermoleophilia bacterium]
MTAGVLAAIAAGCVAEIAWIGLVVHRVRPALRRRLATRLGVEIEDRAVGGWSARNAGVGVGLLVAVVDVVLLVGLVLGPVALVVLVAWLVAG